ncbi:hypothetical protein KIN20_038315 [Parelaphostrongylus tenuis]|uniref:Uncharacterized protein n=1 Tax=Parelaphostrongylus tenuis TaxID=148309 RepID=A0AAD5REY3_PARTN|nr:hypothetical protein KIN20_038315 [Parelaphostrongylus tenuis]
MRGTNALGKPIEYLHPCERSPKKPKDNERNLWKTVTSGRKKERIFVLACNIKLTALPPWQLNNKEKSNTAKKKSEVFICGESHAS